MFFSRRIVYFARPGSVSQDYGNFVRDLVGIREYADNNTRRCTQLLYYRFVEHLFVHTCELGFAIKSDEVQLFFAKETIPPSGLAIVLSYLPYVHVRVVCSACTYYRWSVVVSTEGSRPRKMGDITSLPFGCQLVLNVVCPAEFHYLCFHLRIIHRVELEL